MRINIIGKSDGWEDGIESDGLKWGINYFHPQLDLLWDMHAHGGGNRERESAVICDIPIMTLEDYPIDKIKAFFGTDYFGNSISYMIAFALAVSSTDISSDEDDEIHLYGCAMDDEDHFEQKPVTDFWIGYALGMGTKVVIHGNSTLMQTSDGMVYGYNVPQRSPFVRKKS